jgi:hypothetical protein
VLSERVKVKGRHPFRREAGKQEKAKKGREYNRFLAFAYSLVVQYITENLDGDLNLGSTV